MYTHIGVLFFNLKDSCWGRKRHAANTYIFHTDIHTHIFYYAHVWVVHINIHACNIDLHVYIHMQIDHNTYNTMYLHIYTHMHTQTQFSHVSLTANFCLHVYLSNSIYILVALLFLSQHASLRWWYVIQICV